MENTNRLNVYRHLGQEFVNSDVHPIVFATSKGRAHDHSPPRFEVAKAFGAKEYEVFWVPPPVREGVDSVGERWRSYKEVEQQTSLVPYRVRTNLKENYDRDYGF